MRMVVAGGAKWRVGGVAEALEIVNYSNYPTGSNKATLKKAFLYRQSY